MKSSVCSVLLTYLLAMHVLVFFIVYYMAHNVQPGCDPAAGTQQ
jgi:hypothetical protein